MSMDFSEIRKNIVQWAKENSGIVGSGRHIWLNQNAPQPLSSPYVTLNITSGPRKVSMTDSQIYNPDTEMYDITGVRLFNLDVNVYGSGAHQIATDLSLSIEKPDVQSFFRSKNITPYGSSPNVINITELLDTIIEEREMFELTFMASYLIGTESPFIQTVEAQGINDLETNKFLIDTGG